MAFTFRYSPNADYSDGNSLHVRAFDAKSNSWVPYAPEFARYDSLYVGDINQDAYARIYAIQGDENVYLLGEGESRQLYASNAGFYFSALDMDVNVRFVGGAYGDVLTGGDGDDFLEGGDGSDVLNGGAGYDSVYLSGYWKDYTLTESNNGWVLSGINWSGEKETEILSGIEHVTFRDYNFELKDLVNKAPEVVQHIEAQAFDEDTAWSFKIPANTFADPDGDDLTFYATLPDGEALPSWLKFDAATRTFTGTPPADFNGQLWVRVEAYDGRASVVEDFSLDVRAVNDLPEMTGTQSVLAPGTENKTYTLTLGDLVGGFTDRDDTWLGVENLEASNGTVKVNGDGTFTLTPTPGFHGRMTLSYEVSDGKNGVPATQVIDFQSSNRAPVLTGAQGVLKAGREDTAYTLKASDLLKGFTDADGDPLTVTKLSAEHAAVKANGDGTFTITPAKNFNGPIKLSYGVSDGQTTLAAGHSLVIDAVNDAPTAITAKLAVKENASAKTVVGTLGAADVDSNAFSFRLLDDAKGRFALSGNKVVVKDGLALDYEAAASHTISVEVRDGHGATFVQKLTVALADVSPENVSGDARDNTIKGGIGNDRLAGGKGADNLWGGAGKDVFAFAALSDSTVAKAGRDTVFDFVSGDRFDLSDLDANATRTGNQAFAFIGAKAFGGHAGELRFEKQASDTYVYADTNGDGKADFAIHLDDAVSLAKADFLL